MMMNWIVSINILNLNKLWRVRRKPSIRSSFIFYLSSNYKSAVLAETKKTLSKNEKIGKCIHFIPACVFPRKIRTFKGFLIFFRDRLVLHFHSVSVKQILPSKMKFIIVEEVYIPTYYQFTFWNEIHNCWYCFSET